MRFLQFSNKYFPYFYQTITETGVLVRSSIGLLTWLGSDEKTEALNIGSRLKTPLYPIWVTIVGDNAGLLFSEDRALLRDYRNEYRYSSLQASLTICYQFYIFKCFFLFVFFSDFSYITLPVRITNQVQLL